jgi:hypothetical protein
LLEDFQDRLEDAIWDIRPAEEGEPATLLSAQEAQTLKRYQDKQQQLSKPRQRKYYKNRLRLLCGCRGRGISNLTQLSWAEKQIHCELTWQSFDNLVWLVGCGSEADLASVCASPAEFA